jgi:hypothetical protein
MKTKFEFEYTYQSAHLGNTSAKETVSLTDLKRIVRAIRSPKYTHSRFRAFCGGMTSIYHRDPTSPSGVLKVAAGRPALVDPLIRKYRDNSPLSPTEFY